MPSVESRIGRTYAFNEAWTEQYFCVPAKNEQAQCLICKSILVGKKYNIERHFLTNHSEYGELSRDDKKGKLSVLRKDLKHSTSIFCKSNNENDASNEISFKISLILASNMKPFSDGEIAKKCLEAFAIPGTFLQGEQTFVVG